MFNRGVDVLLEALPSLSGISTAQIRRLLTQAWLEAVDLRSENTRQTDSIGLTADLRKLATALEVHAILPINVGTATVRACAFVAGEALVIANELAPFEASEELFWLFGSTRRFEEVEAGLLYLIAGYDANAALSIREQEEPLSAHNDPEAPIAGWALTKIRGLLTLSRLVDEEPVPGPGADPSLTVLVRHEIWRRIGSHVANHLRWLTFDAQDDPQASIALRALADQLEQRSRELASATQHADLHHLALLIAAACDATSQRALRGVPSPDGDDGQFEAYQGQRARTRPLLWPAAQEYADRALPGPQVHAVVSVPTGAGKSSVAELAIAQALHSGWVLYLAPTNALVGQVRRYAADIFGGDLVREFLGGAEYTELAGESLADIEDRQVLVMTPEKCSLALRQNPEAFGRLSMCVLDEAHILGERNGRGVIAELVLAEIMHRAPKVRLLLLSALVANPGDLARWLENATGTPTAVVDEPWRPTRTLRVIAGFDRSRLSEAREAALAALRKMPASRKKNSFLAPIALLAGLQGAWRSDDPNDYSHVRTDVEVALSVSRDTGQADTGGYFNRASVALAQKLGERGDHVLAFLTRSKHDSFTAASKMIGFSQRPYGMSDTVEAFLTLAQAELGAETALRGTLQKRVAVHTSALLREEQRASELAFNEEIALVMFATGTMAQGLNLPATAVVIGGTEIGYDAQDTEEEKRNRSRAHLLNAIGRAGRAHVAARSIAIVVPNRPVDLDSVEDVSLAARSAEFLREDDASSDIISALDGLVSAALNEDLRVETMSDTDQTAFTFLSFSSDLNDSHGVLSRTWAVDRANVFSNAREIAGVIDAVGQDFLVRAGAPAWIAIAAHQSGIALPEMVKIYHELRIHLTDQEAPTTIVNWARLMMRILRTLQPHELARILPKKPYGESSRLSGIHSPDSAERDAAWTAYERALAAWMTGKTLIDVAAEIHAKPVNGNARRGSRDPLPRAITVVGDGFRFGLSMAAGALGAIVATGREEDSTGPWALPEDSLRCLSLLPLSVRSGATTPEVLAWIRAGVQPRIAAHILSELIRPPEGYSDEQLRRWAYGRLTELGETMAADIEDIQHQRVIRALGVVRDAR
jgi:hypothetical protein